MQSVIYDVAVSIDGFIAGPNQDISKFANDGEVVDHYYKRLETYSCAIMGRTTYEFGYKFGLKPGDNPYPKMKTIVFSSKLKVPEGSQVEVVQGDFEVRLAELRHSQTSPIYLCGGGKFAGSLLREGEINLIRLKRAPIVLGDGIPLFGGMPLEQKLICTDMKTYQNGYIFQEFEVLK